MRTSRLAIAMLATALLAGCASEGAHVELTYELGAIAVGDVARIETIIHVDPKDGRQFFVDQPYRSIALGVGYEVFIGEQWSLGPLLRLTYYRQSVEGSDSKATSTLSLLVPTLLLGVTYH